MNVLNGENADYLVSNLLYICLPLGFKKVIVSDVSKLHIW